LFGKTQRFEPVTDSMWSNSNITNPTTLEDSAVVLYTADSAGTGFTCKDYASYWWKTLSGCDIPIQDSALVINELIAVCNLGTDTNHIYGASSTGGRLTANGDSTFEMALEWAAGATAPDTGGLVAWNYIHSDSCTSLLITNPMPYGYPILYYNGAAVKPPDTCTCGKIMQYYAYYEASGDSASMQINFTTYLYNYFNIITDSADMSILFNACNGSTCAYLPRPVTLPYEFSCDRRCVTCGEVDSAYQMFLDSFGISVEWSPNFMSLVQSWMNAQLGFNITAGEYFAFMQDSCGYNAYPVDSSPPVSPNCPTPSANNFNTTVSGNCAHLITGLTGSCGGNCSVAVIQTKTGSASVSNGNISYQPSGTGNDTVEYRVCNNCNICDTAFIAITVSSFAACNNPPVIINHSYYICTGDSQTFLPLQGDYDPDNYQLYLGGVSNDTTGHITISGNDFVYHAPLTTGNDTFKYVVCNTGSPAACDTAFIYMAIYDCSGVPGSGMEIAVRRRPAQTAFHSAYADLKKKANPVSKVSPTPAHHGITMPQPRKPGAYAALQPYKVSLPKGVNYGRLFSLNRKVSTRNVSHGNSKPWPEHALFGSTVADKQKFTYGPIWQTFYQRVRQAVSDSAKGNSEADIMQVRALSGKPLGNHNMSLQQAIHYFESRKDVRSKAIAAVLSRPQRPDHSAQLKKKQDEKLQAAYRAAKAMEARTNAAKLKYSNIRQQLMTAEANSKTIAEKAKALFAEKQQNLKSNAERIGSSKPIAISQTDKAAVSGAFTRTSPLIPFTPQPESSHRHNKMELGLFGGTFCDSLSIALNLYDSLYVNTGTSNYYALVDFLNDSLGGSQDFPYWQQQIAACGLSCPQIVNCSSVNILMTNFESSYPVYSSSCPSFIWANYLNDYGADNFDGYNFSLTGDQWMAVLNCCAISYPANDTLHNLCDTISAVIPVCTAGNQGTMGCLDGMLNTYAGSRYDSITGMYGDITYWLNQFARCGISCSGILPCNTYSGQMANFETTNPTLADSCPVSIWVNYMNSRNAPFSYQQNDWVAMLNCCGISYPRPDSLRSLCDSVNAAVEQYNAEVSGGSPANLLNFESAMTSVMGSGYTDSTGTWHYYDDSHWFWLLQHCSIACPNIINCTATANLLDTMEAEYGAAPIPDFIWTEYLNQNAGGYYTPYQWRLLMQCCGITPPPYDSVPHFCDSLQAVVSYYNFEARQNPTNKNLWSFEDDIASVFEAYVDSLGIVHYFNDDSYWMGRITACGITCPNIVNCSLADSLLNAFETANPFHDTLPDFMWTNYLNSGEASGGYYYEAAQWRALLQCCGYTPPLPDSALTFCDSLSDVVSYYNYQAAQNSSNQNIWSFEGDIGNFFGWNYQADNGNWYIASNDSFWLAQVAGCHGPCANIVNCGLADTLLAQLDSVLPGGCPASVWVNYLNNGHVSTDNYDSAQYILYLACCGAPIPISGTLTTLCDTMAVDNLGLQQIMANVPPIFDTACIPAWVLEDFVFNQNNALIQPVPPLSVLCPQLSGCGYSCIDTCVFHSTCDSLNSLVELFPLLTGSSPMSNPGTFTYLYDLVFNSTATFSQILPQLISCGLVNPCSSLGGVESEAGPVFSYYSESCIDTMVWVTGLNLVSGLQLGFSTWINIADSCGWAVPPFCHDTLHNFCDTLHKLEGFFDAANSVYHFGDSVGFLHSCLSTLFGYTVTSGMVDSLIAVCVPPCTIIAEFEDSITAFLNPDTCYPAWLYAMTWTEVIGVPGELSFSSVCDTLVHCGFTCPDTCGSLGAGTHCDTIATLYALYRAIVNANPASDSFKYAKVLLKQGLGMHVPDEVAAYDSLLAMYNACNGGLTCEDLAPLIPVMDSLMKHYAAGMPVIVFTNILNGLMGVHYTTAQWESLFNGCGYTYNIDTSAVASFCDSVNMGYNFFYRVADVGHFRTDSLNEVLIEYYNMALGYYPQMQDTTIAQMQELAIECIGGVICATYGLNVSRQISAYVTAHPGFTGNSQAYIDTTLDNYLDSIYGVSGINWCDTLSACATAISFPGCPLSVPVVAQKYLCNRPLFPPVVSYTDDSCISVMQQYAYQNASMQYQYYIQDVQDSFINQYIAKCLTAYKLEHMLYKHPESEFHYTLYYYDQAGNLVQTVPPNGAIPDSFPHTYLTKYRYNTTNQVVEQQTPDAGNSFFWYDRILKLTFSQNAKQQALSQLSYTNYDALQRIIEVGRLDSMPNAVALYQIYDTIGQDLNWYAHFLHYAKVPKEVTHTWYDNMYFVLKPSPSGEVWRGLNLRNRVASVTYSDTLHTDSTKYNAATHYSYDVDGNVQTLLQENRSLKRIRQDFKRLDYQFDLISGKVNAVMYQRGQPDAFYHVYNYDADNRLTDVYTSRDSLFFDHDAYYQYYLHGPLARAVIGDKQIQGVDYAYTIQGWLKAVNGDKTNGPSLMGLDGNPGTQNALVGLDYYGFSLGYFTGDYTPIGGTLGVNGNPVAVDSAMGNWDLFNGNISHMKEFNYGLMANPFGTGLDTAIAFRYRYDQLNRLTGMNVFNYQYNATDSIATYTAIPDYGEHVSYDPNGNILTYLRNGTTKGGTPLAMDSLSYKYQPGNNKLDHVNDPVPATNYSVDIDNEDTLNYNYDQIGNLTKDSSAGIDSIYWTVYGKIQKIVKFDGDTIKFHYGPDGNRIAKEVFVDSLHRWTDTYYVHDAQGNIMATYQWLNRDTFSLDELVMYGSSRLGTLGANIVLCDTALRDTAYYALHDTSTNPFTDSVTYFTAGLKQYEFTNHLGNVLLTLTDRHIPVYVLGGFALYKPEVASAQDYYPFGMEMVGRAYNPALYRFGYNNKEKDDEVKGAGNQIDYGMRGFDPRLGRFPSPDPLTQKFPGFTPYAYAMNSPISGKDMDGLEYYYYALVKNEKNGNTELHLLGKDDITMETLVGSVKINMAEMDLVYGSDDNWHVIPGSYKNKSLDGVDVNSFPTKEETDKKVSALQNIGAKGEMVVGLISLSDGLRNLYNGFKGLFKKLPKGGSMKELETETGFQRHEMPSNSVIKKFGFGSKFGSAAQMKTEAHLLTGSYGAGRLKDAFRATEYALLKEGKYEDAWAMLEKDFAKAVKDSGGKLGDYKEALTAAKKDFFERVVPALKALKGN
jgi:RHS repeat-associated protein